MFSLGYTFRYIKGTNDNFERVFIPGTMPSGTSNDWGPNTNGLINPNALSKMVYNPSSDSYEKSYSLNVNSEYFYKIHFHFNSSGTNNSWISDPLNTVVTDDVYSNSILTVSDPLFFQPKRHLNSEGSVEAFKAKILFDLLKEILLKPPRFKQKSYLLNKYTSPTGTSGAP